MKNGKNVSGSAILAVLTLTLVFPLMAQPVTGQTLVKPDVLPYGPNNSTRWTWIKTDTINIIFPAGGEKPMFLWWHTDDPSNVYVVKYQGLIEYMTFDAPFYRRVYEATELRLRTMLQDRYFGPRQHLLQEMIRMRIQQKLAQLAVEYGLHRSYLPFNAGKWNLTGPVEVTRGDVQYLSFNFTLVEVPFPNLKFAENNVIIRCRFYYTSAEEDVEGLYSYTVDAGQLKMDLVVKNWTWNVDLVQPLLDELAGYGVNVPVGKAGLALWVNLASIPIEYIDLAEADVEAADEVGLVEAASMARYMYVEGAKADVVQNRTLAGHLEEPLMMRARLRERFKVRFERGEASLGGFFKFVPKAVLWDGDNGTVVDVSASYIAAGGHMRLFLCYPYFGSQVLEHDPSLGLEAVPALVTGELLLLVLGVASVVALAVLVVRWKKKPFGFVGIR